MIFRGKENKKDKEKNIVFAGVLKRLKNDRKKWVAEKGDVVGYAYNGPASATIKIIVGLFFCRVYCAGKRYDFNPFSGSIEIIHLLFFSNVDKNFLARHYFFYRDQNNLAPPFSF